MGSDRGEDAYHRENKTTTTLRSSSSSLVSLRRVLATSLTVTRSYSSVGSFVALEPWVRVVLSSAGTGYVVVGGRGSFNSRLWRDSLLLGWCWPSFPACSLLCMRLLIGRLSYVVRPACLCWGLCDVAAGDVEGARVVVDVDDVGVRVVVVFRCQAAVVVCGRPGTFVVVGVTSGRRGGRLLLGWWLWDEEGSCVTICDNVTSESTFRRARAITLGSRSRPNL